VHDLEGDATLAQRGDLTPAALVGESRLDPAQSPRTRARSLTDPQLPRILKAGYKFLTFVLSMEGLHMSLVKVKEKFQVTLPAAIRQKVGVDVGDLLEATVQGKRITFTPKVAVDRYGPFSSAKALVRSLHHESRKLKKR
jgi:AbrB family looped-hinge helix DNA binding protein